MQMYTRNRFEQEENNSKDEGNIKDQKEGGWSFQPIMHLPHEVAEVLQ